MRYRKKPVVIEAMQWDGSKKSFQDIITTMDCDDISIIWDGRKIAHLFVDTLEGGHRASKGDYIIKGVKGEFYPCKPDIFEMTYEKVEDCEGS